jgi:hypothetical protein
MTHSELREADHAALDLAVALTLANDPPDPGRVEQVTDFLNGFRNQPPRPWLEVAEFCAYHQQTTRLNLLPSGTPPCDILTRERAEAILEEGFIPACHDSSIDISDYRPAQLLIDMMNHGVSPYHPDPIRAVEDAKAKAL